MRFLVVLAVICSGIARARIEEWNWLDQVSPNRKIEDDAFRSGREYQFFYNGQLSTGIAGASKQHSANRIQALVTVSFKSQNHVLMRLENVRMGKLNRDIPNPRKIMPFDAFESVEIEQHLKQKLERPVKFSYTGGLVHDLVFDSHEAPWSANIKRGVLNLLQVNLQQQRRTDNQEEARLTNSQRSNRGEDEKTNFYRVMEKTLEGECETSYTIQQQPPNNNRHTSNNNRVLNVTKSINFEKCNKRPQVKYNFRFGTQCQNCDPAYNEDEKFLKSSTVAKYNITGDKQAFLIEGARIDSEYVFTPFNEEANTVVTYVNQTLVLVKSGPAQNIQEPQGPIESDSDMVFTLDWDVAYEKFHAKADDQAHRQLHDSPIAQNKVDAAKKTLQRMANKANKEQLDEDTLQQFTRLVQQMRLSDQNELEQIAQHAREQQTPENERKLRNIIPQALGACGTKSCVKLLTQQIRQGQITPLKGAFAIKGLLHNRVASDDIINEIIQLAESEKARESQFLKRNAWLAAGSLINALLTNNQDRLASESKENPERRNPRELKDKYVQQLFSKLRQSTKWEDKVLMLKTIANAGLDSGIFELEKIIRQQDNERQPMHVRFEAILALRPLTRSVPKKVQKTLMPIAMNRREYPTLRSAAAYIVFQSNPERSILDQLAHNLINEPSHQFAAFVYTYMQAQANSTNPCEKQLSTNMKLALRHAKKINAGLGHSRQSHWSAHDEKQKLGLDLDLDAVFSNTSIIPRHIGADLHANVLGFWQKQFASVNVFAEGLDSLIRRYSDNDDAASDFLSGTGSFLEQIWGAATGNNGNTRHPRSTHNNNNNNNNENQQELKDIFSKHLKIRTREYGQEHENEPKAYLSAAYKGQQVALIPVGKDTIQQLIQDAGSADLRQAEQKLRQGVQIDYTAIAEANDLKYKIPTSLGMPLTVTVKAPVAWSLKGKVQANVDASQPKSVKIHIQLKPSAVAQLNVKIEAWSPIVTSGVQIKTKAKLFAPVDARLEVDLGTKPFSIKAAIKPPNQKHELLVLESRPTTFAQDWQQFTRSAGSDDGKDEKTIMGDEQNRVNTFNKCIGRQTLGVELCARGQIRNTPARSVTGTPFSPLSGPNKIVVTGEPAQDAPEEIHFKFNGKLEKLNGNEMQKPTFAHFTQDDENEESGSSSSSGGASTEEELQQQSQRRGGQQQSQSQEQQQQRQSSHHHQHQSNNNNRRQQNNNNSNNNNQQQQSESQEQQSRSQSQRGQQQRQEQNGASESRQNQDYDQSQERRRDAQSPINRRNANHPQQQRQNQNNRNNNQNKRAGNSNFGDVLRQYRNYEAKKGYKAQAHLEMQAGPNRKIVAELTHIYDAKQRYGQLNMKIQRQQPQQWEACLEAEAMFPERPQFAQDVKDKKILASAQLKWGQSCNNQQNYVKVTTRAERSNQQKEWEQRQGQYQQYRQAKCQNNNKAACSPLAQEDFVEKIAQMLKYRVDIDYQNVPLSFQNATNKVYRALKHYYYWQTDVDQLTENQPNKIRAEFTIDAQSRQRVNVTIKTPKETSRIRDMPLSQSAGPIMNQKQSVAQQLRQYVQDGAQEEGECSITNKPGQRRAQVQTFDGTRFTAPFSDCWVVLAKDCGSQNPNFVVMARKSQKNNGNNPDAKEVKIVTRQHRIHLTPESDEYGNLKIEVNGRPYDPNQGDEINENGQTVARIEKDQQTVQIQSPKAGVDVNFDGYAVQIHLSQSYRGQQCGLCGHFDGEQTDEFRNPDFTNEQDIRQFYMNYLIKDERCRAPKQLSEVCESEECDKNQKDGSSSSSSSSQETQENSGSNESSEVPESKTKVIQVDDQVCFSTQPISQCDEDDSYPMGTKREQKVAYVCISRDNQSAEEIERRVRQGGNGSRSQQIPALKNRTPSFTRTENVPEKCKKYNKN